MPTEWFECRVDVPSECSEVVASFLIDSGAPGVQFDERVRVTTLIAYFSGAPPLEALRRLCADIGCPLRHASAVRVQRVPQENWAENWKVHFRQHAVGERLCICPPWDTVAPKGRIPVVIDPGMAFGTGGHATTRGCLLLLEQALGHRRARRALDVGCGSGILAIALAKLGVAEVWAIDTDPSARAIAAANARCNSVERQLQIAGSLDEVRGAFDVIAANLFANLLEEMAVRMADRLKGGAVLVCSGFLTDDEHRLRVACEACGLHLRGRHEEQSWVTLAMQRPE